MSGSFNLDEYVDVAERIRMFAEKYPDGSLQGDGYFVRDPDEKIIGYHYVARAYRTPTDERPGVGTAYEPIPGKTQFTRDSEVQNSETAAWGRAIVALGFNTKKIASAEEVRNRQPEGAASPVTTPPVPSPAGDTPAAPSAFVGPTNPVDTATIRVHFGKNKGLALESLNANQLRWYAETWEPDPARISDQDRALKAAAIALHGGGAVPIAAPVDDSIPFQRTI